MSVICLVVFPLHMLTWVVVLLRADVKAGLPNRSVSFPFCCMVVLLVDSVGPGLVASDESSICSIYQLQEALRCVDAVDYFTACGISEKNVVGEFS